MLTAKDLCDVLGYLNSHDAIARHCKHAQKMTVLKQHSHTGVVPSSSPSSRSRICTGRPCIY
ncbi:BRO family protein [Desulfatitalea tepidiphila]|uniref:BRO family protein n=1 Tax=Desulfatitalea tepidiphila TaxID=1185843 RepID=UPI00350E3B5B